MQAPNVNRVSQVYQSGAQPRDNKINYAPGYQGSYIAGGINNYYYRNGDPQSTLPTDGAPERSKVSPYLKYSRDIQNMYRRHKQD